MYKRAHLHEYTICLFLQPSSSWSREIQNGAFQDTLQDTGGELLLRCCPPSPLITGKGQPQPFLRLRPDPAE